MGEESRQAREALASGGEIVFEPCHHHAAVGPMAGIISPSMPVWMVADATNGNQAFSNFNEGIGKVLRFGANSPDVITRLKWMGQVLAPTLRAGLETSRRGRSQTDDGAGAAHGRRGA